MMSTDFVGQSKSQRQGSWPFLICKEANLSARDQWQAKEMGGW
jgi:hypothetical protein